MTVKQSRNRIIIQWPTNGGQDCPEVLYEERTCDAPPVCQEYRYVWVQFNTKKMIPGNFIALTVTLRLLLLPTLT